MIHVNGRDYFNAGEIGDLWPDVTPEAVRQWAARGHLNGHRLGRHVYYDFDQLAEAERAARTSTRGNKRGVALTSTDALQS